MQLRIPTLETERLVVREYTLDDLEPFCRLMGELYRDPADHDDERFVAEQRQFLQWTVLCYDGFARLNQPPYAERAIVLRATGEMIGSVGFVPVLDALGQMPSLRPPGDEATARRFVPAFGLYWAISPRHRRHGYATEAGRALVDFGFRELLLRQIIATTSYDNEPSMSVMRHLGMRLEHNPYHDPPWLQVVGILDYPG